MPNMVQQSKVRLSQIKIEKTNPDGNFISFDNNNQCIMEFIIEVCILKKYCLVSITYISTDSRRVLWHTWF